MDSKTRCAVGCRNKGRSCVANTPLATVISVLGRSEMCMIVLARVKSVCLQSFRGSGKSTIAPMLSVRRVSLFSPRRQNIFTAYILRSRECGGVSYCTPLTFTEVFSKRLLELFPKKTPTPSIIVFNPGALLSSRKNILFCRNSYRKVTQRSLFCMRVVQGGKARDCVKQILFCCSLSSAQKNFRSPWGVFMRACYF